MFNAEDPDYSGPPSSEIERYERALGSELFATVPEVQLVRDPSLELIIKIFSEVEIDWENVESIVRMFPWIALHDRFISRVLEFHLHKVLQTIEMQMPHFHANPLPEDRESVHFSFYHAVSPSAGIIAKRRRREYVEYDSLSAVDTSTGRLHTVWEAKLGVLKKNSKSAPHVHKQSRKIFLPELQKYWLFPLVELFGSTIFSEVVVTLQGKPIEENSKIQEYIQNGGYVVKIPYSSEQLVSEVKKRWQVEIKESEE